MSTAATTVAISAAANAQAAAANAAAQEAARKACMAYVRGYEHDRATVTEMREYAGCVDRLNPAPMTGESLGVAKFVVLVMFAAILAGVVWERRERSMSDGWLGAVVGGGLIGLCCGAGGLLAVAGVWWGVRLLLA